MSRVSDDASGRFRHEASPPAADYYDPHPRLVLDRPVLLAGQVGCGAAAMARNVCGRTGLSFVEVDRFLEHRAGRSLARIATEDGRAHLTRLASDAVLHLAGQLPAGLIVLTHAWPQMDEAFRARVNETTHFVRVERPPAFLRPRLKTQVARVGDWLVADWPTWGDGSGEGEEGFLRLRLPLLESAQSLLDAGDQHENSVAEILMASLEQVLEADRL